MMGKLFDHLLRSWRRIPWFLPGWLLPWRRYDSNELGNLFKCFNIRGRTVLDVGVKMMGDRLCSHKDYVARYGFADYQALEIFLPYVEELRVADYWFPVVCGDVRDAECYAPKGKFDLIIWTEGPEHLDSLEEVKTVLSHLASAAKHVIVSCPDGHYPQEEINGNPYEKHSTVITRRWLSENFPEAAILNAGRTDRSGIKCIMGVWGTD